MMHDRNRREVYTPDECVWEAFPDGPGNDASSTANVDDLLWVGQWCMDSDSIHAVHEGTC